MIRNDVIRRLQSYLQTQYNGPITILGEDDDGDLTPPCAIVRIGQSEDMGANQAILWGFNVFVAVFHDADDTSIATAESQADSLFSELLDVEAVTSYLDSGGFITSVWRPMTQETSREETKWAHVHGYELIIAPSP